METLDCDSAREKYSLKATCCELCHQGTLMEEELDDGNKVKACGGILWALRNRIVVVKN